MIEYGYTDYLKVLLNIKGVEDCINKKDYTNMFTPLHHAYILLSETAKATGNEELELPKVKQERVNKQTQLLECVQMILEVPEVSRRPNLLIKSGGEQPNLIKVKVRSKEKVKESRIAYHLSTQAAKEKPQDPRAVYEMALEYHHWTVENMKVERKEITSKQDIKNAQTLFKTSTKLVELMNQYDNVNAHRNSFAVRAFMVEASHYTFFLLIFIASKPHSVYHNIFFSCLQ